MMKYTRGLWKQRWITFKAKVQKSKFHGVGILAINNISKGETVAVIGGIIVPTSEISTYWKTAGHLGIQISKDFSICPTSRKKLEEIGAFNHSCKPNIGYSDSMMLIAIKDIKPKEELVFDYAFSESNPFKPFECKCHSSNCRKIIKPDDWKIKRLQKKYKKYFSPYLRKIIGV